MPRHRRRSSRRYFPQRYGRLRHRADTHAGMTRYQHQRLGYGGYPGLKGSQSGGAFMRADSGDASGGGVVDFIQRTIPEYWRQRRNPFPSFDRLKDAAADMWNDLYPSQRKLDNIGANMKTVEEFNRRFGQAMYAGREIARAINTPARAMLQGPNMFRLH